VRVTLTLLPDKPPVIVTERHVKPLDIDPLTDSLKTAIETCELRPVGAPEIGPLSP
jgi:hypothetical protein